jgi:hypothetical protein
MTMFEQQILCHKLPNSFNNITLRYDEESNSNVRNKIMQDFKRRMLKIKLGQYEAEIQHYESLYEKELTIFETEIHKNNSFYQISHVNELMHYLKTYLYYHTKLLLSHIRYKESRFHVKFLRKQRRHRYLISTKAIGVYPQIIVDVPNVSLNSNQLDFLSRTGQLHFHLSI